MRQTIGKFDPNTLPEDQYLGVLGHLPRGALYCYLGSTDWYQVTGVVDEAHENDLVIAKPPPPPEDWRLDPDDPASETLVGNSHFAGMRVSVKGGDIELVQAIAAELNLAHSMRPIIEKLARLYHQKPMGWVDDSYAYVDQLYKTVQK